MRVEEGQVDVLPDALRATVREGQPALMRFDHDGATQLAVGVPLDAVDGAYFEVMSLEELEATLESISISLLAAALLSTLAGAAIGWRASRRVLRRAVGRAYARWRRSIQVRVVTSTLVISAVVVAILGAFLQQQISAALHTWRSRKRQLPEGW